MVNKEKLTFRARLRSFVFAFRGLVHMLKAEPNFRIQLITALAVICLGVIFRISRIDWVWVILCIGFVLSTETMNSAIEKLTDLASPQTNKAAGLVKDIAAGAALLAAIMSAVVGCLVFWPYLRGWINQY